MNPRTTKDGILSPAPLARLDYPRSGAAIMPEIHQTFDEDGKDV